MAKEKWVLPDGVNPDAWEDFEEHRMTTTVKLTDLARRKAAKLLLTLTHEQQEECVDYSIVGGYRGLFPDKFKKVPYEAHQQPNRKLSTAERAAESERQYLSKIRRRGERTIHGEAVDENG